MNNPDVNIGYHNNCGRGLKREVLRLSSDDADSALQYRRVDAPSDPRAEPGRHSESTQESRLSTPSIPNPLTLVSPGIPR